MANIPVCQLINCTALQLASKTTSPPPIKAFRDALREGADALKQGYDDKIDIQQLVQGRSKIIDFVLNQAWHMHISSEDLNIALIAVGGYGRGELHPGSDIDIMILMRQEDQEHYAPALEQLIMFFWDIGLELGHSVRSLASCVDEAQQDITVATNIMEARLLTGPSDLFEQMRELTGPQHLWPGRNFFEAKWQEQIQRHHKYDDTAYNLEPNIKESPGGLRDIQMIGWVAKRHFNADTLHQLIDHGFLTETEHDELIAGQNFLWKVRFVLHVITKRREDRLLFDHQKNLAERFGYEDSDNTLAVEQFMRRYYRTIHKLNRLNEILLQHFQEAILYADDRTEPTALNKRFQINKTFIEVRNDQVFTAYPFALLEIFLLMQQNPHIKGVRASTIRLIRTHVDCIDQNYRDDIRNRTLFMEIFRYSHGLTHALRRMSSYGILSRYIPAFGHISGLMQYDLFHVYTVDEHTLMVVRNLRRMYLDKHRAELPMCSDLMSSLPKPEIIFLAGLFHDIAKGRGGDHSSLGAVDAYEFCIKHAMSEHDAKLVAWLVSNHLLASMTAQRKDISDPEVINDFANHITTRAKLDYIYLLTIADMRATNPSLWNSWKGALLKELYDATKYALRQGLKNPINQESRIQETQEKSRALLVKSHINETDIDRLWRHLNDDYFLRHNAEEVSWHCQAIIENPDERPLILIQQEAIRGGTEIFIHTLLADHLFATITRALDQLSLTVVDARIVQASHGFTFDTYVVLEQNGNPIGTSERTQEILDKLRQSIGNINPTKSTGTRRTSRQLKHFNTKTRINFSKDPNNQRTIMELFTADRPGILSRVAQALMDSDVDLQNAKITTVGERVEDIFFITDSAGHAITNQGDLDELRQLIIEALEQ